MRTYLICMPILLTLALVGCNKEQPAPTPSEGDPATENQAMTDSQATDSQESQAAADATGAAEGQTAEGQAAEGQTEAQGGEAESAAADDPNKASLELAAASGCGGCHTMDSKLVGPSWKDIAARYADDTQAKEKLIEKVAKGGGGNWTDMVGDVKMPANSPKVSDENIAALVDFVLSLK